MVFKNVLKNKKDTHAEGAFGWIMKRLRMGIFAGIIRE